MCNTPPPVPVRDTDTTWRQFLRTQASTMLVCNSSPRGLRGDAPPYLRILRPGTRQLIVHLLGATINPNGPWSTQRIRNLVMDLGDRVTEFQFLVATGPVQFTASFDAVLTDVGIQVVRIPLCCPRVNCFAERFVRTLRAELTDLVVIFSQRHLSRVFAEYATTTVDDPTAPTTFADLIRTRAQDPR
ncbi:MAG: integrase [Pseudonocardiaceae bacterium]